MKTLIGIIAGRKENTSPAAMQLAEAVGAEIGHRGMGIICGGGDGSMEAACRGCQQAGGTTIGVLKFNRPEEANPYIDWAIPTSMDLARNNIIVWSATGLISFEGRFGTSSEILLGLDIGKPLVVCGDNYLVKEEAFDTPNCLHITENDTLNASLIVDQLLALIKNYKRTPHPRDAKIGVIE